MCLFSGLPPHIAMLRLASPCVLGFCRMIPLRCQWGCEDLNSMNSLPLSPQLGNTFVLRDLRLIDREYAPHLKRTLSLFLLSSGWTTININSNGPYQSELLNIRYKTSKTYSMPKIFQPKPCSEFAVENRGKR